MREPSIKQLRYLINDEKSAAKLYSGYGFKSLARDERKHRRFLIKKLSFKLK